MSEPKTRECHDQNCPLPATHTLVWTETIYYCPIHTDKALQIANVMGFPTPGNTVREMTIDEMILDES